MIALLALTSAAILSAQSQRQAPRTRESKRNPPSSSSQSNQRETATDQRGTETSPIVVETLPVPKTQEQAAQEQRDREQEAANKRGSIWLAGFTVLVLIIQSFVLWQQNRIMRNQTTIMDGQATAARQQAEQMLAGLALTRESAKAATESAAVARQTLLIANRAWLLHHDFEVNPLMKDGQLFGRAIVPIFKNVGTVPALDVRCNVATLWFVSYDGTPFPKGQLPHPPSNRDELRQAFESHGLTIGPGVVLRAKPVIVTFDDSDLMLKGMKALVVHTYSEYLAGPTDKTVHKTEVCVRVILASDPRSGHKTPFDFEGGPTEHNSAR